LWPGVQRNDEPGKCEIGSRRDIGWSMAAARSEMRMRSEFDRKNSGEGVVVERYTVAVWLPGRGTVDLRDAGMSIAAAMEVAQTADWKVDEVGKTGEAAVARTPVETIAVKSNAGQPTEARHNAVKQNDSLCSGKLAEYASTQALGGGEVHVLEPQHVQELV
jgi:hypothetical protein